MLNQKEIELTLFERKLKNDLNETSGDEYETLLREIEQMLDDEYAVMNEIKKTIEKAIESFSDNCILSDKVKTELADKKRDIFTIGKNTEIILVRQRELLCFSDLKQDSITKNFDLIYQMSLREAAYSNKSYLTIDEILNNANAESDTQLDFVSMNSQLSFI